MQYNALIIDQQIESRLPMANGQSELKQIICRLDGADRLTRMYEAADQLNERPCLCLVVTDRVDTVSIAQIGGFEAVTSEEYAAMNG